MLGVGEAEEGRLDEDIGHLQQGHDERLGCPRYGDTESSEVGSKSLFDILQYDTIQNPPGSKRVQRAPGRGFPRVS